MSKKAEGNTRYLAVNVPAPVADYFHVVAIRELTSLSAVVRRALLEHALAHGMKRDAEGMPGGAMTGGGEPDPLDLA